MSIHGLPTRREKKRRERKGRERKRRERKIRERKRRKEREREEREEREREEREREEREREEREREEREREEREREEREREKDKRGERRDRREKRQKRERQERKTKRVKEKEREKRERKTREGREESQKCKHWNKKRSSHTCTVTKKDGRAHAHGALRECDRQSVTFSSPFSEAATTDAKTTRAGKVKCQYGCTPLCGCITRGASTTVAASRWSRRSTSPNCCAHSYTQPPTRRNAAWRRSNAFHHTRMRRCN